MSSEENRGGKADVAAAEPPLPFYRPAIGEDEIRAVSETLRSGWLTMGPKTREFEAEFARFVGARHAVAVSSATAGLHLGLDALGIGPGDEVLVPDITFTSTAATVVHRGARPIGVDVESDTLNMNPSDAARKMSPRTRLVVPVHFAGHPCPMDEIERLASRHSIPIMEDAAHALPAAFRGRRIGTIGKLTVFSFYATKNLTTGEGGMVTTDEDDLAAKIRSRRLHGMNHDAWRRYTSEGSWRYDVSYPGYKYNMTDPEAAMGLVQLRRLPDLQKRRLALVEHYRRLLAETEEIELPAERADVEHAWHLFVVRVRSEKAAVGRDQVVRLLGEAGIGTSVHFIPLHEHSYYRDVLGWRAEDFPNSTAAFPRMLSLPLYPAMTGADVDRVARALQRALRGKTGA